MANSSTNGYVFGATELVTNAKLHTLVTGAAITVDTTENTVNIGSGTAGDKQINANNGDANLPNLRFNDTTNKWQFSNDGTTWTDMGTSTTPTLVTFTSEPSSNLAYSGVNIALTLSSIPLNFGDVGYISSSGTVLPAKSTAIANANALVMAVASNPASSSGTFLMQGIARNDSWNWTVGSAVYLATSGITGLTLTQTAPVATDSVTQILGYATHADRMFFNPNSIQIEHT